jgi:hypothetical protein
MMKSVNVRRAAFLTLLVIDILSFGACAWNIFVVWPIPVFGPDAIGYIGPALQYFDTSIFASIATRGFLYPLFLLSIYRFGGTALALIVVQKLLYLSGVAMFWYVVNIDVPAGRAGHSGTGLEAASLRLKFLSTAIFVYAALNGTMANITSFLHPESLTFVLTILVFLLLIQSKRRPQATALRGWGAA